jgi:glycosyltransferase involved in cell wall biosynthesis
VTVIIPTLNEVRAIGSVLEEVLSVGVPRGNVVVVDGGSTGGSVEIATGVGSSLCPDSYLVSLRPY